MLNNKLKNKKKFLFLILVLFLLDRLTKEIVRAAIPLNFSIPVLKNSFHITHITNTGIAFGLARNNNQLFLILSGAILLLLILFFVKSEKRSELVPVSLIIAGAAGNILDRIVYGSVCDFLDFRIWPVFNLADSFITIGGVVLFYLEFLKKPRTDI
ncbi:MAG: signal peptidase II [bacterium]